MTLRIKKIKYLSFILVLYSFGCNAQNYLPDNSEIVNHGNLNLNTVVSSDQWGTSKNVTAGKFSNYGAGKFIDGDTTSLTVTSSPAKWVDGYVKHYAITGYQSHVYPVGSATERLFVSTTNEIAGNSIAIAWIPGAYNVGTKNTNIKTISSTGRWSWLTSLPYTGNITATVKIPVSITVGSNLRLVGWNGEMWIILADNEYSAANRTLTGKVPFGITTLGIGSTTTITNFKNQADLITATNLISAFVIYPNPAAQKGSITLDFSIKYQGFIKIVISDLNGKKLHSEVINISQGKNIYTIDNIFHTGIYNVSIYNESETIMFANQKLVIK